jgi:hypothetical protein
MPQTIISLMHVIDLFNFHLYVLYLHESHEYEDLK